MVTVVATAPDIVTADPIHASIDFEDARLRIVRVRLPPREKIPMHSHPDRVVVNLTDVHVKITLPDGTSGESDTPAGHTNFSQAVIHAGENTGDALWEIIEVELKKRPRRVATPGRSH
jgi:hypothetical protein